MNLKRYTPRFLAAALTLSIGLASSAFAMPHGEAGGPGFSMHGASAHFAHGGKAMQRLHDDLKLDAKQEAAWQTADKFTKETFSGAHERLGKQRQDINAALSQPGADLRAILKRMDELKAEGQKQHEAVRDQWLAVYDTLNADQKESVRLFFKRSTERMARAMDRRGPHQGGKPGPDAPAAPAPRTN